jgi:hypothetical protein
LPPNSEQRPGRRRQSRSAEPRRRHTDRCATLSSRPAVPKCSGPPALPRHYGRARSPREGLSDGRSRLWHDPASPPARRRRAPRGAARPGAAAPVPRPRRRGRVPRSPVPTRPDGAGRVPGRCPGAPGRETRTQTRRGSAAAGPEAGTDTRQRRGAGYRRGGRSTPDHARPPSFTSVDFQSRKSWNRRHFNTRRAGTASPC